MTDPLDYDADAGARLLELLVRGECSFRQNLVAAVRKAGQQLEFLKPSTMMMGRHGFAAGPAAQVERGTVLIVLANARRVFTAHLRMPPAEAGFTRLDYISASSAAVREACDKPLTAGDTLFVIRHTVATHGGAPGAATPMLNPQVTEQIVGALFGVYSPAQLTELFHRVDTFVGHDVCPALVGLTGRASSGKAGHSSGVWPLLLPLAPYIDAFVAAAER